MNEPLTTDQIATPQTDAVVVQGFECDAAAHVVYADFARAQERSLNEALHIIRDYFWVENRKQGREVDKRANAFLIKMGVS